MRLPSFHRHALPILALWLVTITVIACTPVPATDEPTATVAVSTATAAPLAVTAETPTLLAFPTSAATLPATTLTITAPIVAKPVVTGIPPVVQVISPLTNTQLSVNQTFFVVAYATSENTIGRIEVLDDNSLVRSDSAPVPSQTFSTVVPWTPTQIGTHYLRVIAYDANGVASPGEEISISVTPDVRKPTASIVYPIGTPQVEFGSILQVYAVGTDEVGVTQLDLLVDNQMYTYVAAPAPSSATFATMFAWTALQAGNHTLVLRVHDTQDQTTDSAALKVFVVDTRSPVVSVAVDRINVLAGEPVTVTVTALDVGGLQRVELWTGKELSQAVTSATPARQTSFVVQIPWQSANPGDYALTARAYGADGTVKESPAQIISVLRAGQPTPTHAPSATPTRTRTPRPLPTATLHPPAAPVVEISQPSDRFAIQGPLKITFSARASGELERVELWGYYVDQPNPQVICTLDAKATTQMVGQCEWPGTAAGTVGLYAQAIDIFDQVGRSAIITGTMGAPATPTPTPPPVSLTGRWTATTAAGQFTAVLRPIVTASGTALRGDFKIVTTTASVTEINGRVASGTVKSDRANFRVEFTPLGTAPATLAPDTGNSTAVPTSTPATGALDFECGIVPSGPTLDCRFKDARGAGGSAVFQRE